MYFEKVYQLLTNYLSSSREEICFGGFGQTGQINVDCVDDSTYTQVMYAYRRQRRRQLSIPSAHTIPKV